MAKIPEFKFDLQGIVNSVKQMLNPEVGTPKVSEGDPIGTKVVQISTLLQTVANAQAQSAKDLTQINSLLNDLYKDLEVFRKLEAEMRQKQQAEAQAAAATAEASQVKSTGQTFETGAAPTTESTSTTSQSTAQSVNNTVEPQSVNEINLKKEEEKLKRDDQSPLHPTEGTSTPSDKE